MPSCHAKGLPVLGMADKPEGGLYMLENDQCLYLEQEHFSNFPKK